MKDYSTRPVWVEINLEAIRNNFLLIKNKLESKVKIMPVVKADAYGHGARKVAAALVEAGADRLAVALPEEGVELRESGISLPIQILFAVPEEQYHLFFDYNLIATVSDKITLDNLNKEALARSLKLKVHIVLDTGRRYTDHIKTQLVSLFNIYNINLSLLNGPPPYPLYGQHHPVAHPRQQHDGRPGGDIEHIGHPEPQ